MNHAQPGDAYRVPHRTIRHAPPVASVGLLLGFAAAIVGVRWPDTLQSLPTPSTFLMFAALALALTYSGRETLHFKFNAFDAVFLTLIVTRSISEVVNAIDLTHEFYLGSLTTQLFLWLATIPPRLLIRSKPELRTFLFWLALPSIAVAVLAIMQLARFPGVTEWILENVGAGGLEARVAAGRTDLRATSTIGHWTALGGYLAVAMSIFCAELLFARKDPPRNRRAFAIVAIVILFMGELTTLTFSTVAVAAAVVLATFLRLRGNPILVAVVAVAGVIGWQVFGSEIEGRFDQQSAVSRYTDESLRWLPSTVAYRIRIWESETIPAWLERPLTGWGQRTYDFPSDWGVFPRTLFWNSPESQWLNILVRGGIIDLLGFILLLVVILRIILMSRRAIASAASPFLVLFVGLVVTFLINSPFSTNGVPQILWPLLGALLAARHLAPSSPIRDGESSPSETSGSGQFNLARRRH